MQYQEKKSNTISILSYIEVSLKPAVLFWSVNVDLQRITLLSLKRKMPRIQVIVNQCNLIQKVTAMVVSVYTKNIEVGLLLNGKILNKSNIQKP